MFKRINHRTFLVATVIIILIAALSYVFVFARSEGCFREGVFINALSVIFQGFFYLVSFPLLLLAGQFQQLQTINIFTSCVILDCVFWGLLTERCISWMRNRKRSAANSEKD